MSIIDIDRLKEFIKDTLSPEDYRTWQQRMQEYQDNEKNCLVAAFFRDQQSLPPEQRKYHCHISCPCPNCSPGTL
jgi:hypothetical protein